MTESALFWLLSAGCVVSAAGAVFSNKTAHAALWLAALAMFAAGLLALDGLRAPAGLIFFGAVAVAAGSFVFPAMLTGKASASGPANENRYAALVVLIAGLGGLAALLSKLPGGVSPPAQNGAFSELFNQHAPALAAVALASFAAVAATAFITACADKGGGDDSF
ncbi:MAG: hypothetical protein PHW69_07685 [Elusimicrobiaceae bacterium]|nr:hypothetical protein [Elusimicrobiaceae bacterium]